MITGKYTFAGTDYDPLNSAFDILKEARNLAGNPIEVIADFIDHRRLGGHLYRGTEENLAWSVDLRPSSRTGEVVLFTFSDKSVRDFQRQFKETTKIDLATRVVRPAVTTVITMGYRNPAMAVQSDSTA